MRGADTFTESLFTMRHLDDFVPANHPLRPIKQMVNAALLKMDALLGRMYAADIKDLSVNNIDRQVDLAQRNDGSGQVIKSQEGVLQLLIAHQQFPEPVEPAVTRFDNPAPRLPRWISLFLSRFALAAHHMRDVSMRQDHSHGTFAPITRIGTQMFRAPLSGSWTLDNNGIKHRLHLRYIVHVGSRHDERQRDATPVHQKVALAAIFSPDRSGWVRQPAVPKVP